MPAFTDVDGTPMSAHVGLLRDHLRGRLGFRGVIVSDYHAIAELLNHGVAADLTAAAALALHAGIDIDMMSEAYRTALPEALDHGLVTMAQIDAAVRRVLELKERLGLFGDPYRRGSTAETAAAVTQRRQLARTVAARSLVLLSNERQALPLASGVRELALLGPLADAPGEMRGPWAAVADASQCVSVLAGLREQLPQVHIMHAAGVALRAEPGTDALAGQQAALQMCATAEVIVLCLGESATQSGEAASRAHPELPEPQRAFAQAVIERARALGKPVVAVLFSGRPLVVPWLIEQADAVLAAWFPGSEAGHAIADILTGERSPSGRTPVSWPRAVGQIPVFFGERPSGRPYNPSDFYTTKYLDESNEPLFAFGHGLGYGRCALANLQVAPAQLTQADTLELRVEVHNPSERALEETVFVFTHIPVASVTQPRLTLQAFGKVNLGAGQRSTLTLQVPAAQLRFLGPDLEPLWQPGTVRVFVGASAERSRLLSASIELRA
jgi:beta-glucosidase